mgnify:CR=1 FL=1
MTNISCIIVEDQKPAQRILETYIERLDHVELVATCCSAMEAMPVLAENEIDLMFLDLHLPKLDGFSFLKSLANPPKVIVTTAYSDQAVEGFELSVIDYLLKPFSFERFCGSISKLSMPKPSKLMSDKPHSFFIKVDGDFIKLDLDKLVFIASDANFVHIHMVDTRYHIMGTLQSWEAKLPSQNFVRVHKSHIVNTDYIEKISGNQLIVHKFPIPIGRLYRDRLLSEYVNV